MKPWRYEIVKAQTVVSTIIKRNYPDELPTERLRSINIGQGQLCVNEHTNCCESEICWVSQSFVRAANLLYIQKII